ncbi:MAG: tRNA (adenosine(37)-N6)-threonylcarbamoyltransferase complex dimerization subunit type 1 TsaB, partial [Dehalococcoidia bacterium]
MYLFIDTATRYGAVGLWRTEDSTFVRVGAWWSRHNHTAELMPAIEAAMAGAGIAPSALRGLGVITGPGGFSALRAGMGVAKGLAFALSIPLVGVSALEATAYAHKDAGWPVCAVMEAGWDAVAWARFQQTPEGWRRRTLDRVTPLDGLLAVRGRHTLFCGEGIGVRAEQLREAL